MAGVPFRKEHQLNAELVISHSPAGTYLTRVEAVTSTLPGYPLTNLDGPDASLMIGALLKEELRTPDLDALAPHLWLVSTPRSAHISPLHHQAVRGRSIIITENPQLHLIWYKDKIFLKPVPRFLLSHAFWSLYLTHQSPIRKAAVGYLRSYFHLIKHESDFRIAQREGLVPSEIQHRNFCAFISVFGATNDSDVSPRFENFGELRLTRLNLVTRVFLFPKRLTFHHMDAQWSDYFGSIFVPLLSTFAVLSILLDSMQVALAATQTLSDSVPLLSWKTLAIVSRGFSITVMVFMLIVVSVLSGLLMFFLLHDNWFARRELKIGQGKDETQSTWNERKSAIV